MTAKLLANIFYFYVFLFCAQVAYSADPVCGKWFERNIKKIQSDCELDCSMFGTDMGTFYCPSACDDLCTAFKKKATSRPGRFLFYPGLTSAERKLVDQNPKEAITVFIQKTRAESSSSRNFPVQGFNDESDAFRHYIWVGLLTREIGAERAQLYLDAHEENPLQAPAERAMDLANNRGGILGLRGS